MVDETDASAGVRREGGDLLVEGHVAIADLADYGVHLEAPPDAYNSVGGLVFTTLGRLPRRGDEIAVDGYSLRVESARDNRVGSVRIASRH